MTKSLFIILMLGASLSLGALSAAAQSTSTTSTTPGAQRPRQPQLVGEITTIDTATGQIEIKTDAGKTLTLTTSDSTAFLKIAPGERTLDNATKIARADLAIGDRVLVRNSGQVVEGQPIVATQLIVVSKQALAGREDRNREDWRRRGISGRITALNPGTKEVTITARSRDAMEMIVMKIADNVKVFRYAPDSVRQEDALPSSFADLKVGDQLRARGERSADRASFAPEEIIAGAFTRAIGTITSTDPDKGELTIKETQSGKSLVLVVGKRSTIRRIPADFVEQMAKRREAAEQRRAANAGSQPSQPNQTNQSNQTTETRQAGQRRREGAGNNAGGPNGAGRQGGRGPGGGLQQLFENMPAVTVAELKKGDMVFANGTQMSDASRITAINITTGDASIMQRLQQFQGRPDGPRNMSPGLPGNVGGGGTGSERERP